MGPPAGRCVVCGRPLSEDAHWITEHPDGEHETCRRWDEVPFPFERELAELRRVARGLAGGYRATVELGRWLSGLRRRWPEEARDAVVEYRDRKASLQLRLITLAKRLKW